MIVAIHQPEFLPWPGFFNKMWRADIYVILDDVQFTKGNWQNRNRVFSKDKDETLITAPVQSANSLQTEIRDMKLSYHDGGKWQIKNWRSLRANYADYPFFEGYSDVIESLVMTKAELLVDYNLAFINWIRNELGIETPLVRSSSLGVEGSRTKKLIEIVKALEGTTYLSGSGGRAYLANEDFHESGIRLLYQDFSPPCYFNNPQRSVRSAVDLLLAVGPQMSSKLIQEG